MSNYYFSAIISTGDSAFGGTSLYFDGNDSINVQGNKEFNFSDQNFNVEMWIRPDSTAPSAGNTGAYASLITTATPTDNRGFLLAINPNYSLHWAVGNAGTAWSYTATSTRSISPDGWSHVALTRENNIIGLYINGELENFRNVSGLLLNNTNNNIQIGGRSLQNQYYKGYLDEIRITTGISRYSKLNTDYQFYTNKDTFYADTSLLLDYENNTVSDISINKNQCIPSGDIIISDLQKFLGKPSAVLGEGTGYIVVNSGSSSFNFGTGDFTIESWIHPINSQGSNYIPIIETRNSENSTASFSFGISLVNNEYVLDFNPRGGSSERLYSNSQIPFNTWSYIALTRKNGICSMFVNGLKQENTAAVNTSIDSEVLSPTIGLSKDDNYFNGYINDFRITKACRYINSFDYPRSSIFKDNTIDPYYKNTLLLLKTEMAAGTGYNRIVIDDSYNRFLVSGSATSFNIVQSGTKFGNACAEFSIGPTINSSNMSGGYISVPNSGTFDFNNEDFTIEFWHKRKTGIITGSESASTCCAGWYGRFFTTYFSGGGFDDPKDSTINYGGINILMEKNSTTGSVYFGNDGDSNYFSGSLNMGFIPEDWTYYTLMKMGNSVAVFKSGILIDSLNINKPIFKNSSGSRYSPTVNIGGTVEGYHSINGFIDSFRITKGYARYPYMFTGRNEIQETDFITLQNENPFLNDEIIALDTDINNKNRNNVKPISISRNGAAYFDGFSNLEIAASSGFDFSTSDFTLEFWFKNSEPNNGILFKTSTGNEFSSMMVHTSGDNNVYSHFSFLGNAWNTFLNLGSADSGVWNHFAISRNKNNIYGYKNGTIQDQKNNINDSLYWNSSYFPIIGGQSGNKNINGFIDEFRLTNGYARYASGFSPKTTIETVPNDDKYFYYNQLTLPFDGENNSQIINDYSIAAKQILNNGVTIANGINFKYFIGQDDPYYNNVSLLLLFDPEISRVNRGGFLSDASKNNFKLKSYGDMIIDTTGYKMGGGAAFFSGNPSANYSTTVIGGAGANYIDVPPSVDFDYGTGDFTIEFWYKATRSYLYTPLRRILAHPLSSSQANSLQIWHGATAISQNRVADSVELSAANSISKIVSTRTGITDGCWHHYAFSRISGISYCFLDGRFRDSGIDTTNYNRGGTEGIRIGGRSDLDANTFLNHAYLDELRITKGIGRYLGVTTGSGFVPERLSNRYCSASHHKDMIVNSGDDFTIECWLKPFGTSTDKAIFSKGVSGDFNSSGASDYILKFDNSVISSGSEINISNVFIDSSTDPFKNREELRLGNSKEGDLLIAVLTARQQPDTPYGWSLYGTYLDSMSFGQRLYVYTKTATSSEPGSYYFTTASDTRLGGVITRIENGGQIDNVTISYGNGSTSTINTVANRLNLTVFTWIYANNSPSVATYSQSASDGSLRQITDSPRIGSRISAGYTKNATTVTSTIQATTTAENPNHNGICIQIIPNTRPLSFYSLDVSDKNPLVSYSNILPKKWYHCAIVKGNNGTRMYVNGIEESFSPSGNWSAMKSGDFYVGTNFINKVSGVFDGIIDGFKFTRSAKYKSNFNIDMPENEIYFSTKPILADKYYENNILSLEMNSFDGDKKIYDNSVKNFNIINSGTSITSETSTFGRSSALFSGSGYLAIENNPAFHLVNNDFTIECWFNMSSINRLKYLLRHHHTSGYGYGGWSLGIRDNHLPFFSYGDGVSEKIVSGSQTIKENIWQHLAVCRNSNKLYLFTNGELNTSYTINDVANSGNSYLYIGTDPSSVILRTWSGYIDNLKITTGVCKYLPKFNTPNIGFLRTQKSDPHFNNVTLLMYGNNTNGSTVFYDDSRFNISRLGNGCAYFSGTNSFITMPLSGIGNFGSSDFTIEVWAKPGAQLSAESYMGILNKASGSNSNNSWRLYLSGESTNPVFEYTLDGSSNNKFVQGPSLNNYNWNHIAVTRNGNYITVYSNGLSGNPENIEANALYNNNLNMQIGNFERPSSVNMFNGFLEDLRITDISRYTGNFENSLPSKYGNNSGEDSYYSNTNLLMHFNGFHNTQSFKDNSANQYIISGTGIFIKLNNDIVTNGTTIINSSEDSVFGGASIRAEGGTSSSLHVPSRYDFGSFGKNDFTIEWWDEILGWNGGYFPVLHYGNDGDYDTAKSRIGIYYSLSGANLTISMSGNEQNFPINLSSTNIALSGWKHNAITRRNGVVNLFTNGIKHPSGYLMDYDITRGVNISTVAAGKYGAGVGTLYTANGFIDDLRVTKNIARYIENFNPPNEQFANF